MKTLSDDQCDQLTEAVAPAVLRELTAQGYPVTGQRRALVDIVMSRPRCFTAEDLLRELRDNRVKVGRATVFRTLELLLRLGFVSRVFDGGRWAYTVCSPGHHHHLTCSGCGQVLHVNECLATTLLDELESRTGYQIEQHRLEMSGICPSCQKKP